MARLSRSVFRDPAEVIPGVEVYRVEDSYRAMREIRRILDREKGAGWNHWPFAARTPSEESRMFVLGPEMIIATDPRSELTPEELQDNSYDPFMLNAYYVWTKTHGFRWYACFVDGRLAAFKNDMTLSGWYCEDGLIHPEPLVAHRPGAVPERRLREAFSKFVFRRDMFMPGIGPSAFAAEWRKFRAMADDPDPSVRLRVAMADYCMASSIKKDVEGLLDGLAGDPDVDVRMAVARNRAVSCGTHYRMRHDRDWRVRLTICSASSQHGRQDGSFFRDRSYEVRLMCAMTVMPERYFDPSACSALLHDAKPEVRFALVFVGLEGHPRFQAPALLEMAENDPDERLRACAMVKLAGMRP